MVAAALQAEWGFSLDVYLPDRPRIDAETVATSLGFPSPREDYGRVCMGAVARSLRSEGPFPFNYEADWEGVMRRLLAQLVQENRRVGA